jgi:hypothetical protein
MKKVILLFVFFVSFFTINAQTKDSEFFKKVQKLVSKAEGEKFLGLMGNDNKVGDQIFSFDVVSVTEIGKGKYSSNWVHEYSNIDWTSLSYFYGGARGNDKLSVFYIKLKKACSFSHHVEGEKTKDNDKRNTIEIYFLSKHLDEIKALFDGQYR